MAKFIVRAADEDFVEVDRFDTFDEAVEHADRMQEMFGCWNVEMYKEEN